MTTPAVTPNDSMRLRRITVPSSTNPTTNYIVVEHPSGLRTCSCPAGQHHRTCKHLTEAPPSITVYRPPLRHRGPCGHRATCHRSACVARFGTYPTVEFIGDTAIYYCHGVIAPRLAS